MSARHRIHDIRVRREVEGYLELGMPDHALQTLERISTPAAFSSEALYLRGESLRMLHRYGEAIGPLEQAAKAAPDDVGIRIALGWCYKRTGRLDLAIDALQQALLVEPEAALLRYNLACYLSLAGQKRRALRYLAQALAIDPAYRKLIDAESDFDPMRADPEFQAIRAGTRE